MIVVLLVTLAIIGLIRYILHVKNMETYLKDMKTLPHIPFIGNVKFFWGKTLQQMYEELVKVLIKNGSPLKIQIGPSFFVIVDHPDDVQAILTSPDCLDKPFIYDFFYLPLSILTQRGN